MSLCIDCPAQTSIGSTLNSPSSSRLPHPRRGAVVVVPVYNSVNSLPLICERVSGALQGRPWKIVLVDDRSPNPKTWPTMEALAASCANVSAIRLLKNRGRASAVFCGLAFATRLDPSAAVVVMDDDLQHDPLDVPRLLDALADNPESDVAIAQFPDRQHTPLAKYGSWVKSQIDRFYYGLPANVKMSAFVALTPTMVAALNRMSASFPLFGPQLIKVAGRFVGIECRHAARHDGIPGYTAARRFRQMYHILLGDTVFLLKAFTRLGVAMAVLSLALGIYFALQRLTAAAPPEGWTMLIVLVTFIGGVNIFLLGLIGANVVRAKENVERVPAWTIRETVGSGHSEIPAIATEP